MKRIFIIRHGEKADSTESDLGLTNQGVARAFLIPNLINSLIYTADYSFYVYANIKDGQPTSRSYYTAQLVTNKNYTCDKKTDIDQLVQLVVNDPTPNIFICWEHSVIPTIIERLIGVTVDYKALSKQLHKQLTSDVMKIKIKTSDIDNLQYCASDYLADNLKTRDYVVDPKRDVGYSLVFDIDYNSRKLEVYPGIIIDTEDADTEFTAKFYLAPKLSLQ